MHCDLWVQGLTSKKSFQVRELKAWLGGQRFAANDELQDAVKTYLSSLAANFFAEGIEKLVSRYDKCLNLFGDYVETLGNKIIMLCQFVFFYSPSEVEKKTALVQVHRHQLPPMEEM